jgi:hypothetical protein
LRGLPSVERRFELDFLSEKRVEKKKNSKRKRTKELNALIRHKALAIVVIAGVAAVIIITWRVVAMRQRADDALQEISEVAALPEISISASDEVALEAAAAEAEEEEREAEELAAPAPLMFVRVHQLAPKLSIGCCLVRPISTLLKNQIGIRSS